MTLLLIEGLDLAGKSTAVHGVMRALQEAGHQVRLCRNALTVDNPIHAQADAARMANVLDRATIGGLYVAAHALDLVGYASQSHSGFQLQDSSWLRCLALHRTLARQEPTGSSAHVVAALLALRPLAPRFRRAVFLRASISARAHRLRRREREAPASVDEMDRWVLTDPDRFLAVEEALRRCVYQASDLVVEIDTTDLSPADVVSSILYALTSPRDCEQEMPVPDNYEGSELSVTAGLDEAALLGGHHK